MNYQRAQQIISKFPDLMIVTIGDLMLDEFIWGEARRISPEAPTPVVEVKRETWHLGGAANVVSNLLELGARAAPIGVVGSDDAARMVRDRFAERNAGIDGVITDASRPTTRKTRVIASGGRQYQQIVRADREDRSPISDAVEDRIIAAFNQAIVNADAVVVSDYDKGLLTPRVLGALIESARARARKICLDPKIRNFAHYRDVEVITPNQNEAERASGVEITDEPSLNAAARRIRDLTRCKNVLITRGELGMSLLGYEEDEKMTHIPTTAREVYEVTGAGDTVIATLALALASGANLKEAAIIANHAAGVVVGKVGVAPVSRDELLDALKQ
jgi:D-beta-D-heptose 7-phosphate kinase/D-beta-D-heptose 1-phosphate adenosyltransferase